MIPSPTFIIGTERSGSNLLRLLLCAHPHFAVPHPPHLMRDLSPFVHLFGDLNEDARFRELIASVKLIVAHHFAPWPLSVDENLLFKEAPSRSLYGIYVALYEQYRRHLNRKRWACKSTFMYQHIREILDLHPEPRFIHLIRDPRDVAASASQSVFSRFHPYKEAQLWVEQQMAIESWSFLEAEGKLFRLRYEDLVQDPKISLKNLMGFLNEDLLDDQLLFFRNPESIEIASLMKSWGMLSRPISTASLSRYKLDLNAREIESVEFVSATLMKKYGYPLSMQVRPQKSKIVHSFAMIFIEISDLLKRVRVEVAALFFDKNFFLRWHKAILIQYLKLKMKVKSIWVGGRNGIRTAQ
ncbi:MAG: sulfotransferase [Bdellovibrionales bacterium]|nr:sulfotransferase [Bdellovibrionales bacterium]